MIKARHCFVMLILLTKSMAGSNPDATVDFDASMQTAQYPFCTQYRNASAAMNLFRTLYDTFAQALEESLAIVRIPHLIHHIWLGSSLPQQYVQWRQSWIENHPDWTFILWTDNPANYHYGTRAYENNLDSLIAEKTHSLVVDINNLQLQTQQLISHADNYGQRSDILRYELLFRFGGLYVDTDFSCLRSFAPLHSACDFYVGIQPLATNMVQLGIGLIGAIPRHPILAHTLEQLKNYDSMAL